MLELIDQNTKIVLAYRDRRDDGFLINQISKIFYYFISTFVISKYPKTGCDLTLFTSEVKITFVQKMKEGTKLYQC